MKINNKGELKALIKECLIEILSEGMPVQRTRQVERAERSEPRRQAAQSQLPPNIPSSMRSIFQDTQQRAASDLYREVSSFEKQTEVLGEMAETWEGMAFAGQLPDRAFHPGQHKAAPAPQNHNQSSRAALEQRHYTPPPMPSFASQMSFDDDIDVGDDGFDPLAAVLAARKARG